MPEVPLDERAEIVCKAPEVPLAEQPHVPQADRRYVPLDELAGSERSEL